MTRRQRYRHDMTIGTIISLILVHILGIDVRVETVQPPTIVCSQVGDGLYECDAG